MSLWEFSWREGAAGARWARLADVLVDERSADEAQVTRAVWSADGDAATFAVDAHHGTFYVASARARRKTLEVRVGEILKDLRVAGGCVFAQVSIGDVIVHDRATGAGVRRVRGGGGAFVRSFDVHPSGLQLRCASVGGRGRDRLLLRTVTAGERP